MATYEVSTTGVGTTGAAAFEFMAGAAKPASVLEMGIFLSAATASKFVLGRPGNTPTTGTLITATQPITLQPSAGVSLGGLITTGWGTAPTVPAAGNSQRTIGLAGAVGNGVVWNWAENEMVVSPTRSLSLVLWNPQTNGAPYVYVKWIE